MNILVKCKVQRLKNIPFIYEGDNNFIMLLQSLEHVETHLEGWFVVLTRGVTAALFSSNLNKDTSQLQRVIEHMVLNE